jgi:hypothetical protein
MWIHGLRDNLLRPPNWPMAQVHIETDDGTSCWTAFRPPCVTSCLPSADFFFSSARMAAGQMGSPPIGFPFAPRLSF